MAGTAALMLALSLAPALAHSKIKSSVPRSGGTVKAGLDRLEFGFRKPVRLILVRMKRTDGSAKTLPAVQRPRAKFAIDTAVAIEPLSAGRYALMWTAIAKDGHVMKGTIAFTVAP
ncbi:MAG: copper resistance CopC family protein [Pseudomonadota bacterium]